MDRPVKIAAFWPDDEAGIARARAIRVEVFVDEYGVIEELDADPLDTAPNTVHLVAWDASGDLGTARVVADADRDDVVHFTRVAVRAEARVRGVGRALMHRCEEVALAVGRRRGLDRVTADLSVMDHAADFYRAAGYTVGAEAYIQVRIPHRRAHKLLGAVT